MFDRWNKLSKRDKYLLLSDFFGGLAKWTFIFWVLLILVLIFINHVFPLFF